LNKDLYIMYTGRTQ